jgi:rhodanese-related sulfurtransferase
MNQSPPTLLTMPMNKYRTEFAVSPAAILKKVREKENIILIDVRNRDAFEKFWIPGSINMPLHSIKTKIFLRSKPSILVNEGFVYSELQRECERLLKDGFSLSILWGGLNSWRQSGGILEGDKFAQKTLNKISAQDFFLEKEYEDLMVFYVSNIDKEKARSHIPHALFKAFEPNPDAFVSDVKKSIRKNRSRFSPPVLIVNDKGEGYDKVEKILQKAGIKNVFFLKDGLTGYRSFLRAQELMKQPKKYREKRTRGCKSCP